MEYRVGFIGTTLARGFSEVVGCDGERAGRWGGRGGCTVCEGTDGEAGDGVVACSRVCDGAGLTASPGVELSDALFEGPDVGLVCGDDCLALRFDSAELLDAVGHPLLQVAFPLCSRDAARVDGVQNLAEAGGFLFVDVGAFALEGELLGEPGELGGDVLVINSAGGEVLFLDFNKTQCFGDGREWGCAV